MALVVMGWLGLYTRGNEAEKVEVRFVQSSRHHCPDYANLVRVYLDPYRWPVPEDIERKVRGIFNTVLSTLARY
jgi:hypothetical protein